MAEDSARLFYKWMIRDSGTTTVGHTGLEMWSSIYHLFRQLHNLQKLRRENKEKFLRKYQNSPPNSVITVAWNALSDSWDLALFYCLFFFYTHFYHLDKIWLCLIYKVPLNYKSIVHYSMENLLKRNENVVNKRPLFPLLKWKLRLNTWLPVNSTVFLSWH